MQILSNAILEYKKIFPYIRKKRKIQIVFSIILSLVLAITESIGISSLFPFIGSILNPEKIYLMLMKKI